MYSYFIYLALQLSLMAEKRTVYIFGHSFPARFVREAHRRALSVASLLGVTDEYSIQVEGHPGLTYRRIFGRPDHYFSRMSTCSSISLLCIDMGSNDLCDRDSTPAVVVGSVLRFLWELATRGIRPQKIVFLSVLQRSKITSRNQVSVQTFNHRIRRFNRSVKLALAANYPTVSLHPQRGINYPKYLAADGCHLTADGMQMYIRQLLDVIIHYCN